MKGVLWNQIKKAVTVAADAAAVKTKNALTKVGAFLNIVPLTVEMEVLYFK